MGSSFLVMLHRLATLCVFCSLCLPASIHAQVNIWTWHGDDIETNWRTGQNASETTLTPAMTSVYKTTFGKLCYYPVDGQVYAQPLVMWDSSGSGRSLVYVVTQNDSIYMFDGTNVIGSQCTLLASALSDGTGSAPGLLPSGETPVLCGSIGGMNCGIIAPKVGILGNR